MFDTMTLTKIVGGFCGALLIFLLGKWVAETVYHSGGHGHGDHHDQAYVIDTGDDSHGDAAADEGPSFAELFVSADVGKGERVFNKCKACHKLEDGANGTGPYLYGVVGRDVDAAAGFGYSGSLAAATDVWTPDALNAFLESPAGYAPGTSMGFSGLKKIEDRANVIAFLDQLDGDTYEMEVPAAEDHSAAESEEMTEEASAESMAEEAEEAVEEVAEAAEDMAEEVAEAADTMAEEAVETAMTSADGTEEAAEEVMEAATEEVAEEVAAVEEAVEEQVEEAAAAMAPAGDAEAGKKVFRKCKACHVADEEKNRVGPHLVGVVGRAVAGADGFRYSDALSGLGGNWTRETLDSFLADPKGYAPGNKMTFAGLKKADDRANVIAYLEGAAN